MAGGLKPASVGTEGTWVLNKAVDYFGADGSHLFNGVDDNYTGSVAGAFYLDIQGVSASIQYIDITLNQKSAIWSLPTVSYPTYLNQLRVDKWNGSGWDINYATTVGHTTSDRNWTKLIELYPGRYRFSVEGQPYYYSMHSEWFIEDVGKYSVNTVGYCQTKDIVLASNIDSISLNDSSTLYNVSQNSILKYAICVDTIIYTYINGEWVDILRNQIIDKGMNSEIICSLTYNDYAKLSLKGKSFSIICAMLTTNEIISPYLTGVTIHESNDYDDGIIHLITDKNVFNTVDWKNINSISVSQQLKDWNGTNVLITDFNLEQNTQFQNDKYTLKSL